MARSPRKPAQAARPRLPLEDEFQRLLLSRQPHDVCETINETVRRGKSRLWCNGSLVTPQYFRAAGLYVQAEPDPDGRWRCTIKSGFPPMEAQEYRWELEQTETSALRRRGPPGKHDWPKICGQIVRECIDAKTKRLHVPKRNSHLVREVRKWADDTLKLTPPESDLAEYVKEICAALREVRGN